MRLAALQEAPYAFGARWEDEVDRSDDDWKDAVVSRHRFVAELDGQAVGMVGCARSTYTGAADLTSMWVHPDARRRGIGRALVLAVVDWARESGLTQVLLSVADGNDPAECLYMEIGFKRIGMAHRMREGEDRIEHEMSLRF